MPITIGAENLDVLRDSAFEIPKAREAGDFGAYLGVQLDHFFDQTTRLTGQLADRLAERAYWLRELSSTLEAVVDLMQQGERDTVKFLSLEPIGHGDSCVSCRGNPELILPEPFTTSWSRALKGARHSGTIPTGIIFWSD